MNRPKLLLITPPYHSGVVESAGVWMPLHFVYVAGAARAAGAEVVIYDAMSLYHTHDDIAKTIADYRPDIVGVTAITAMEPDAREVCATAKRVNPNILTILGNTHPTFMWQDILQSDANVDLIVRGEGEQTIAEVVKAYVAQSGYTKIAGLAYRNADGVPVMTGPRHFVENLDVLQPAWDLVDWPKYFYRPSPHGRLAITSTSRGCVAACSFCSQQKFWQRQWRARSPESVVAELEHLRDQYDVRVTMFADETPTTDLARWERILDLLIARRVGTEILMETRVVDILRDEPMLAKYRQAGVSHVYVGVEATRQASLELYEKDINVAEGRRAIELINQHGMISETSFVLGTPDETPETIKQTIELAKLYAPDMAFFLAITPWPYSAIYPALKSHLESTDYRKYNLTEAVVKPDAMTTAQMTAALGQAAHQFFGHKFQNLDKLSEPKQKFMIKVANILMNHSYLAKDMQHMKERMPGWVKELLARIEADERANARADQPANPTVTAAS
jgi:anaerobic magnesium-protoporphyrin IX monomethyl ester cyclase